MRSSTTFGTTFGSCGFLEISGRLYLQLEGDRKELTATLGRAPTNPELATAAGVTEQDMFEALQVRFALLPRSLSAAVCDDDGREVPLVDLLGGDDPAYQLAESRVLLASKLERLAPRDRRILHMRYFHDLNQSRIGAELGISQMHVSRLIRRALDALGEMVEAA